MPQGHCWSAPCISILTSLAGAPCISILLAGAPCISILASLASVASLAAILTPRKKMASSRRAIGIPPTPWRSRRAIALLAALAALAIKTNVDLIGSLTLPTAGSGRRRDPEAAPPDRATPPFAMVRMDDPLVLEFPAINKRGVVVSSAIAVPSEGVVVFNVRDPDGRRLNKGWQHRHTDNDLRKRMNSSGIQSGDLVGFRCLYDAEAGDEYGRSAGIYLHATNLGKYRSTDIWACALPGAKDARTRPGSVRIVPPVDVDVTLGSGEFRIADPATGHSTPSITLCGRETHNITDRRADEIGRHYRHYARLGVTHLVYYGLEDDEEDLEKLVRVLREASSAGREGPTVALYVFPRAYSRLGFRSLFRSLERFCQNDCMYRSRGADWILGQFDTDEILVGVPSLATYLSSKEESVKAISVDRYLPMEDRFPLDETKHPFLRVSSRRMPVLGKTMFRPQFVKNSWVHKPVNPRIEHPTSRELKLLHYRQEKDRLMDVFREKNMKWVNISHPYSRDSVPGV